MSRTGWMRSSSSTSTRSRTTAASLLDGLAQRAAQLQAQPPARHRQNLPAGRADLRLQVFAGARGVEERCRRSASMTMCAGAKCSSTLRLDVLAQSLVLAQADVLAALAAARAAPRGSTSAVRTPLDQLGRRWKMRCFLSTARTDRRGGKCSRRGRGTGIRPASRRSETPAARCPAARR